MFYHTYQLRIYYIIDTFTQYLLMLLFMYSIDNKLSVLHFLYVHNDFMIMCTLYLC